MPILRIVSDSQLPDDIVNQVKVLGSILGYNDPRCIWVEVSDGLTQPDVMAVTVTVEKRDFEKQQFEEFCIEVGQYLREAVGKSVEVVRPTEFGVHSICWGPTEEGAQIYGGGQ